MNIKIVADTITREEMSEIAKEFYGNMIKGVVDVENEIIALGGEYHMDANMILMEHGSRQDHVWGFNIYLDRNDDWLEYVSLINIRPAAGNRSMFIEDQELCQKIKKIITKKIA